MIEKTIFIAVLLFAVTVTGRAEEPGKLKQKNNSEPESLTIEKYKDLLPHKDNEIGASELLKLQKKGAVVLLDVRSKESFARRHIKGSINIPLTDLTETTLLKSVPSLTTPVVLICNYSLEQVRMIPMTLQAHPVLAAQKFTAIYRLNLWSSRDEEEKTNQAEQNKLLIFEGTAVK
jgi:hypothetical protein